MTEIKVPELGENIDYAEVLKVLVSEGEEVGPEQPVLELETDKAAIEMPSPEGGVVGEILVGVGDTVTPGQTALRLREKEEAKEDAKAERAPEPEGEGEGERDRDRERDREREREAEAEAERPPSPPRGEGRGGGRPVEREPEPAARAKPAPADRRVVPAGPATRRFAREVGVELDQVARFALGDRVTRQDVKSYLREGKETRPAAEDRRERLSGLRRTAADRLAAAWREIPHVTHHDRADITELEAARRQLRAQKDAPKLTVTALAAKAVIAAVRAYPRLNASLDLEAGEMVYHGACHIGVAVDTEYGLLVPVVRHAERKTTRELTEEIAELADRARARDLAREEMEGATFSITNLGGIGGLGFTPIIVPPQVAILGLSRATPELTLQDSAPVERLFLPLSLSYDHRAVDGAVAARFTAHLARLLESPLALLLDT